MLARIGAVCESHAAMPPGNCLPGREAVAPFIIIAGY